MNSRRGPLFTKGALTRPRLCALFAALIFVVCISRPLAALVQRTLILHLETVDETNFREAVSHAPDEAAFLSKAWHSGKIPHREAVIRFLKDNPAFASPGTDEILLSGARDGDASVRETALASLATRHNAAAPDLIAFQLTDPDPDLRQLGVNYFSYISTNAALPVIALAVNDTNVIVAASAIAALQKITKTDFGLRVAKLVDEKLSPEVASDFASKRQAAKEWLTAHEIKPPPNLTKPSASDPPPPLADFELRDLKGNAVHLSDFGGKTVLLNFWTTWCTACQPELATLNELQKKHPNDLVILGISLDSDSDASDAGDEKSKRVTVEQRVARTVTTRGVQYRILLDPKSSVGARFNGGELPSNVIISKDGRFERRFIGPRSLDVFEAMLRNVD